MSAPRLSAVLNAATELAGLSGQQQQSSLSSSLESVLRARLDQSCFLANDPPCDPEARSLDELRLATAMHSVVLLTRLQLLLEDEDDSPDAVPLLGTRDTVVVQTLVALVFNWGTNALLASLYTTWPSAMPSSSRIVDLTDPAMHLHSLISLTDDILHLTCSYDREPKVRHTRINAEFLSRHLADVMRAACTLGWAECIDEETRGEIMAKVSHILGIVPPSRTISALGFLVTASAPAKADDPPPLPPHARKPVSGLLSQQILRENGVQGLCTALLGDENDQEDAPYDRLEQISKLLSAVPTGMKFSTYFEFLIPRLFELLSEEEGPQKAQTPPAHKRAAAFTISRLLAPEFRHVRISRAIILRSLHLPILSLVPTSSYQLQSPYNALQSIVALVSRMDPSPPLFSAILGPIIPSLVTLLEHLERTRTTAPELRENMRGLVLAWSRVAPADEATAQLWAVVNGAGRAWEGHAESLHPVEPNDDLDALPPPSELFGDSTEVTEDTLNSDLLMLRPDPTRFVDLLREISRDDVAGALFVRTLEAYQHLQRPSENELLSTDGDPRRPLLYLQLVLQIQSTMPKALETLARSPERLLTFVRTAIQQYTATTPHTRQPEPKASIRSFTLEDLRIVEDRQEEDSDDEDEDAERIPMEHGGGLVEIALNLLLSLLELHESLLPGDTPSLLGLLPLLEQLAEDKTNATVRRAAREALFVLRARSAASSVAGPTPLPYSALPDDAQTTYQRALKLIDDPLLPVRASGLALLRSPTVLRSPALVPAVLDAFMRTARDGESFVYLNAVQGLVALALSPEGRSTLPTLVHAYADGARGLNVEEVDKRLRVGEALNQVVKHLDAALAAHVDAIVPPLFALVREHIAPTVLRASALGILAQCIESAPSAMLRYTNDLSGSMLDLLQTETEVDVAEPQGAADAVVDALDDNPTMIRSKHPPLRRAAAHLLSLLIRSWIAGAYSGADTVVNVSKDFLQRARVVLGYVSSTDKDGVVRLMCREAGELIEQLFLAHLGVE